jgi:hypothetical protein
MKLIFGTKYHNNEDRAAVKPFTSMANNDPM